MVENFSLGRLAALRFLEWVHGTQVGVNPLTPGKQYFRQDRIAALVVSRRQESWRELPQNVTTGY